MSYRLYKQFKKEGLAKSSYFHFAIWLSFRIWFEQKFYNIFGINLNRWSWTKFKHKY